MCGIKQMMFKLLSLNSAGMSIKGAPQEQINIHRIVEKVTYKIYENKNCNTENKDFVD